MTSSPSADFRPSQPRSFPPQLLALCAGLGLLLWGVAATRHGLLQSNAYDLGLFDQWAWLIGSGAAPISSMEQVHVLADHGAWMLYLAGTAYRILPSIHWLLASQALALSCTALPIWWLAEQAGLTRRRCWLVCALWWLQPVVFNAALFDFHPETWVMPAFALALWAEREGRPRLWFGLLLLMLGCRDGLVLITAGMAIDLACRRRWRWKPGGRRPQHRLAAPSQPLAVPAAPGWRRAQGRIANVQPFERRSDQRSEWPGLGWRSGISAVALSALHRPVAAGLPQHVADRTAVGAGESALGIRQLPHPGASLQPAPGGGGRCGLHRWPAAAAPTPAGLSLDAVLGHGLLAGAGPSPGSSPGPTWLEYPNSKPSRRLRL